MNAPSPTSCRSARPLRVVALCAVLFAALLARPRTGHAQPAPEPALAQAHAAFSELRYDDALRLLDQAWRQGTSGPDELRQIFELAGRAAGVIGEAEAARTWFARWLSLDPNARLPEGTSPKLTQFLTEARARLGGVQLDARATRRHGSAEVDLALLSNPLALVAAIRAGDALVPSMTTRITTPASRLELLDHHGNVVALVPVVEASAAGAPTAAATTRGWHTRWSTWAITATVAATGGAVALAFAARADARLDELALTSTKHDYTEVEAEERTLERSQWIARVALGAAAASAVAAAILYFREDDSGPMITATPEGASLSWSTEF